MRRLPVAAFVALVIATVAAFFVTQHLKVSTPLIDGFPAPFPSTIDPVGGGTCPVRRSDGRLVPVSFRRMSVSFYLLNRADDVNVYVVAADETTIVDQIGFDRHMGVHPPKRSLFTWDGRRRDGSPAPDGIYYIRVSLVHQGRSLLISSRTGTVEPVTVQTKPPPLTITGVTPTVLSPSGGSPVTIHYTGNAGLRPQVLIYRVGGSGRPRQVKSYAATSRAGASAWDGTIRGGAPAPPGTYLIALGVTDRACTTVTYPARLPPSLQSASRAVVTVSP